MSQPWEFRPGDRVEWWNKWGTRFAGTLREDDGHGWWVVDCDDGYPSSLRPHDMIRVEA